MSLEKYPAGKLLFLTAMLKKGYQLDRATLDWKNWEDGFMTKQEWDETAKTFYSAWTININLGRQKK